MREPWGTTAHEALRWAYGLLARSETMPSVLGDMVSGTRKRGSDMTMLDYRAQGAVIRLVAESLPDLVMAAHLTAYYLPKPVKERVPGGRLDWVDRFIEQRQAAVYTVAQWLLGQAGTGTHHVRGFMEAERQYCARTRSAYKLARAMRIRYDAVKERREELDAKLDELREDGLRVVQARLEQKGLLQPPEDRSQPIAEARLAAGLG
ncbi:MAG TPA: hypothetical protein PKV98_18950 [Burkholderiaceae bacterium]|nr:hypothetical protein [Burkholderiaceae bacterium]